MRWTANRSNSWLAARTSGWVYPCLWTSWCSFFFWSAICLCSGRR